MGRSIGGKFETIGQQNDSLEFLSAGKSDGTDAAGDALQHSGLRTGNEDRKAPDRTTGSQFDAVSFSKCPQLAISLAVDREFGGINRGDRVIRLSSYQSRMTSLHIGQQRDLDIFFQAANHDV